MNLCRKEEGLRHRCASDLEEQGQKLKDLKVKGFKT
jgi:hypothetical protein